MQRTKSSQSIAHSKLLEVSGSGKEHVHVRDHGPENNERDRKLAQITAPLACRIESVLETALYEAFPPTSRDRELKKAADTFASTGRNVFVHYITPILEQRRKLLLASGLTKKKYPKTAAQLWPTLGAEEEFFWNEAARELRLCMKQNLFSKEDCLLHAARPGERESYLWHAEVAVATYLDLPQPATSDGSPESSSEDDIGCTTAAQGGVSIADLSEKLCLMNLDVSTRREGEKERVSSITFDIAMDMSKAKTDTMPDSHRRSDGLLDTLPDRFEYELNMLYSHFAHYDYEEVRRAEGKHQTAMLRQLADRFDATGKVLFYYYVVPRLCKQVYPPSKGDTVTSQAADMWRYLPGAEKNRWAATSLRLKKQLGDGDIEGLEMLRLDSLDPDVLKLHQLAQDAIEGSSTKKGVLH